VNSRGAPLGKHRMGGGKVGMTQREGRDETNDQRRTRISTVESGLEDNPEIKQTKQKALERKAGGVKVLT